VEEELDYIGDYDDADNEDHDERHNYLL